MPELPEVETVRRGLDAYVVGRRITSAEFLGARVVRRHVPGAADLALRVQGSRVTEARRRGKYLWLTLEPGPPVREDAGREALLVHLGMSGQLLVQPPDAPDEKHLHARFGFADGRTELRFVDQRTFGGMALAELDEDGIPEPIAHIAPDPLEAAWDEGAVVARM
jgi:formamidopyrimidine-DNA glycosylase